MKVASDFMIEVPVLHEGDYATRARQILRDDAYRELYVTDTQRRLIGYVDITDVLRVSATRSNVTIEGFMKEPPIGTPSDPIEKIAEITGRFRTDSAAIVDIQRRFLGGVLLSDLFPVIITRHPVHGQVHEIMSRHVISCTPDDTVSHIISLIIETGYSAFPVVMKRKMVIGVISRRDILKEGRLRGAAGSGIHIPVSELMTRPALTTGPDDALSAVGRLMVQHDISIVPVVKDGVLVGIVDRHDLLRGLLKHPMEKIS